MVKNMDTLKQALPKITEQDCNSVDGKKRIGKGDHCEEHGLDFKELKYDYFRCPACDLNAMNEERDKKAHAMKLNAAAKALDLPARLKGQTFDNYVTETKEQKQNKAMCMDFAECWKESGGVIMVGGVGTGKTHLAVAICQTLRDQAVVCHLTSVNKIVRRVRSSWSKKATDMWGTPLTEEQIIKEYVTYDLLVIDEIGSQYGSESERIIINEIINDRYESMVPTIIIGNVSIEEAKQILGDRVVDRIKSNGYALFFDWKSNRALKQKQ